MARETLTIRSSMAPLEKRRVARARLRAWQEGRLTVDAATERRFRKYLARKGGQARRVATATTRVARRAVRPTTTVSLVGNKAPWTAVLRDCAQLRREIAETRESLAEFIG